MNEIALAPRPSEFSGDVTLLQEDGQEFSPYVREILRSSRDCVKLLNAEGQLLSMNVEGQKRLGISDFDEVRGTFWPDLWTGPGSFLAKRAVKQAQRGGHSSFEAVLQSLGGEDRWWEVSVLPLPAIPGQMAKIIVVSRDITERKQAELHLQRQEARLQLVVDHVPALIAYVDDQGICRWVNRAFQEWDGTESEDPVGRSYIEWKCVHAGHDYAERLRPRLAEALAGRQVSFQADQILRGHERKLFATYTPDIDENGHVRGAVVLVVDGTEQYKAADALRASSRHFQTLTEALPSIVWSADPDGQLDYISERFHAVTGREPSFGLGTAWEQVIHPDELGAVRAAWQAAVQTEVLFDSRYRIMQKDGSYRWFLARALPERKETGEVVRWVGASTDIHDQVEIERHLREQERSYRLLFEHNPQPMWTYDPVTLAFTSVNEAATRLYGYTTEEFLQMNLKDLRPPEDVPLLLSALAETGLSRKTFRHLRKDGTVLFSEVLSHEITLEGTGIGRLVVASDVTERVRLYEELRWMAEHDPLTGLPNATVVSQRLEQAITQAQIAGTRFAFMALDFDRFKQINDTFGHQIGDRFLAAAAARLRSRLRPSDTLARVGGDEFVVLVEGLSSVEEGMSAAETLIQALGDSLKVFGLDMQASVSVGLALFPDDGLTLDNLQRCADQALYAAKAAGKSCSRRFSDVHSIGIRQVLQIETELRTAIKQERLHVLYQPLVSPDGEIKRLEALLRFHHPILGDVSPERFIPIAEQSGLIVPIGRWVLHTVCRQLALWSKEGRSIVPVSVNVSALQFSRGDLAMQVREVLDETGVPADMLEIELTESLLMTHIEDSVRLLGELKSMGISIAIDDFGIGYSSLSYLHDLPLDCLKIDRSFVQRMTIAGKATSIIRTIVHLAKSLGLQVVAEGIETQEQQQQVIRLGCDLIQGFLCGRPGTASATGELLRPLR